jgi:hypothetical protein
MIYLGIQKLPIKKKLKMIEQKKIPQIKRKCITETSGRISRFEYINI